MQYIKDESLTNFQFWSGAVDNAKELTYDEMQQLDDILPEYFDTGDGRLPTDTEINDTFWMEFETICHALGYAYIDGKVVRSVEDLPEELRLEKLKEYLDGEGWSYTDEQLKKMDNILVDNETYKVDVDNDGIDDSDLYNLEDEAKEAGINTEEPEDND